MWSAQKSGRPMSPGRPHSPPTSSARRSTASSLGIDVHATGAGAGGSVFSGSSVASLASSRRSSPYLDPVLSNDKLRSIARNVGEKAAHRFGSLSEAFRSANTDHRGELSRAEARGLLCGELGVPMKDADLLFDNLGGSRTGAIAASELRHAAAAAATGGAAGVAPMPMSPGGGSSFAGSIRTPIDGTPLSSARATSPGKDQQRRNAMKSSGAAFADGGRRQLQRRPSAQLTPPAVPSRDRVLPGEIDAREGGRRTSAPSAVPGEKSGQEEPIQDEPDQRADLVVQQPRTSVAFPESPTPSPNTARKKLTDTEFAQLLDAVGWGAAARFRTTREAFKYCDEDGSGLISRDEFGKFLRHFGFASKAKADQFFDYLDKDGTNEVDANELRLIFGKYIQPGHEDNADTRTAWHANSSTNYLNGGPLRNPVEAPWGTADSPRSSRPCSPASSPSFNKLSHAEFERLTAPIWRDLACRVWHKHNALGALNDHRDGKVSRQEMCRLLRNFGKTQGEAEQIFDYMDKKCSGELSIKGMIKLFGNYVDRGGRETALDAREFGARSPAARQSERSPQRAPPSAQSGSASTRTSRSPSSRSFTLSEAEFRRVADQVHNKILEKSGTVWKAVRGVIHSDGAISREETRRFFRNHGIQSDGVADRFFDRIDREGRGTVDYNEFASHFAPSAGGAPTRRQSMSPPLGWS